MPPNETDVLKEQVRIIYKQLPGIIFIPTIGAIFLSFLHIDHVPDVNIITWLSLEIIFTSGSSLLMFVFYKKYKHTTITPQFWLNAFNVLGLFSGIAWASSAYFLYSSENIVLQLVLILYLYSASSLIALTMTAYRTTFYMVTFPMLLAIGLRLAMEYDTMHALLSFTTFIYIVALYVFHYHVNQGFVDSIRLFFEKNELAKQLQLRSIELERENKSKSRFLAAASHDLRQPLIAQDLLLDALYTKLSDNSHDEIFNKLNENISSLHTLFNELIEVSKIDTGNVKPKKEEVDLNILFAELNQQFLPLAEKKKIKLNIVSQNISVISDNGLLKRIMNNLTSNAIKYTSNGEVIVRLLQHDNRIKISVEDTGIGISEQEKYLIYNEFYRSTKVSDNDQGFGLGLAIVKRLCLLLEHALHFESEEGVGTIFSVTVPVST